MRLKSLQFKHFRCYTDFEVTLDPALTTFVGENNVGKSTVSVATKMLLQAALGVTSVRKEDYPYSTPGSLSLSMTVDLSPAEVNDLLISPLLAPVAQPPQVDDAQRLERWLLDQGSVLRLSWTHEPLGKFEVPVWQWQDLFIRQDAIGLCKADVGKKDEAWPGRLLDGTVIDPTRYHGTTLSLKAKLGESIARDLSQKYRVLDEFRTRSAFDRSERVESLTGADLAGVLLNLKNHADVRERDRYDEIIETFRILFPRYRVDAVQQGAAPGKPDVQFLEKGRQTPISLSQVSAGVNQMLTLLTNMIGREGQVIVVEHPETHLHPHSMRLVESLVRKDAGRNQIIVVTHDPHFVDPRNPQGLRRFWWTPSRGTHVFGLDAGLSEKEVGQIQTATRHLQNREMVFARSVLLVEDESQREFVTAVAPTLGYDLDAHSISVIEVGSHDAFGPFQVLLEALRIPYACLRDLSWGNNPKYPPDRFFSFGKELEEFLDSQGLASHRKDVMAEVGTSKRRVAWVLGGRLMKSEIPPIFDEVLKTAIRLATGEPDDPSVK